jgi:hypothetical protein
VKNKVGPAHSAGDVMPIANVADDKRQPAVAAREPHVMLLLFVPAVDHDARRLVPAQQQPYEIVTERAGAAGDENSFALKHGEYGPAVMVGCKMQPNAPDRVEKPAALGT